MNLAHPGTSRLEFGGSRPSAPAIRSLFASIAPFYDLLNHLLSLGIDRRWRQRLAKRLDFPPGARILDLATGTGDLAGLLHRAGGSVLGIDFCLPMLKGCKTKLKLPLVAADALRLPIGNSTCDLVTIAFGIRNFEDPDKGLAEAKRVLKPGGEIAILEFGLPTGILRRPYLLYFQKLLPKLGGAVSGNRAAYRHLADSVAAFPAGRAFSEMLHRAGFQGACFERLSRGIAYLYFARKPGDQI